MNAVSKAAPVCRTSQNAKNRGETDSHTDKQTDRQTASERDICNDT